ncbi:unnamed protein product [Fraxinus pennsylvanica]|uniref:Pentatricopeptide repeat-containing protein n=1 Tax=Fraxinus pennsylvanica TaxID=56036 RepID=A0AAD1Z884_9LAMI|nr:unnamed protein product [Fraxinus pennsylvanica]
MMGFVGTVEGRKKKATGLAGSDCEVSLSEDLYNERNLKKLVHKFKLYSSSDHFRTKNGIYESTVRRLASAKRFKWIEKILEHQKQFRHDISKENFSIRLVKLYGQSGMFENAKKVFDEMSERNCERSMKSVNAILLACVNSGKLEEIEGIFQEMEMKWKVRPDVVSYMLGIKTEQFRHKQVQQLSKPMTEFIIDSSIM